VQWTPVLLSEALLAHDVYVCLELATNQNLGLKLPRVKVLPGTIKHYCAWQSTFGVFLRGKSHNQL